MSKNKILVSFDSLNIRDPLYILADGLELWLLLSNEDFLSRSEIETLFKTEDNVNKGNKIDKIWNSISPHFQMRTNTSSIYYPFEFKENRLIPKVAWKDKPEYKLYLNLLITSRLKFLKDNRQKIASDFETICKKALQDWLPKFSCKLFSPGSDDRKTFFDKNLRHALFKLAYFINEVPYKEKINEKRDNRFCLSSSGDNGLDLVGVKKFSDQQRGAIVFFGQCATKGMRWEKKTLEAHYLNFKDYMSFSNTPINIVFIPILYRDNNNNFIKEKPLQNCLLVDRQRLLSMVKPENISQMSLNDFEII